MQKTKKEQFLEIVYLTCLSVYFICSTLTYSPIGEIIGKYISQKAQFTVVNWVIFSILVIVYIFKDHQSKKEIFMELSVVVLFSIVTYTTQNVSSKFHLNQWTFLFTTGMFIACATTTKFKRIVSVTLATSLFVFVFLNILSITNIVPEITSARFDKTIHYMGYYYYTHPSYYMLFAWLIYMYLRGEKKIGWIELCLEMFLMYKIYDLTTCRLGLVASFAAFVLYIIIVKLDLINMDWKITKFASITGFGLAAAFTLGISYIYSSDNILLSKINSMINGRLYLVNVAFEKYNINLFGRLITPDSGSYYYLDSSYAYALFGCGIIFFIVVLFMHSYLLYHACKEKNKPLVVWLITLLIFTMCNDVWVNITYCPLILNFFIVMREQNKSKISNADQKLNT